STVEKIYAHESLTFNNTVACEVVSKCKAGLKDDMDARYVYVLSNGCMKRSDDSHDYYWEYASVKAKGDILGLKIIRDQSDNTLRVSQFRIHNKKLVHTLLKGHSTLSLKDSLSGDCDVKENGKRSYIYAVEIQEYQVVCMRPNIASVGVDMLDGFDRRLQTNVQVFVDFDYAIGRSITVMRRSITGYGLMILGCAGRLKANLQYMEALSTTKAGYMTFTEAWKKEIWLRGLLTDLGYELRLVAGIATGALVKGCSRSEVPTQVKVAAYREKPTRDMFNDGLSLHKFAYMALPDHSIDVIDDDAIVLQTTEANAKKVEECLVATIKIGVSCSVDSPQQRMKIEIVVIELQRILNVYHQACIVKLGVTSTRSSAYDWSGISCGKRHKRVTVLRLFSEGLEGPLSPHVGNLSFLRELDLGINNFQGIIPDELGRLSRLHFLYLDNNNFSGVLPMNLSGFSNLKELWLARNNLVGSIPKEMSLLSKLARFSIAYNKITGGIPPFLGNITSMEVFSATMNPFGGTIPDALGLWKNLTVFYCHDCNLYGSIPHSIFNLSILVNISLSENQLRGSLPSEIGNQLPNLELLQLRDNELIGVLPPSISNCSKLRYLEMSNNNFSGKLTIDFSKQRDISFISLHSINFHGRGEGDDLRFIDSLKNCTRLKFLELANCNFIGVFPISIGNLSDQLNYLSLGENQLFGSLPLSIGSLVGLTTLLLETNQFKGKVPTTIGKLQKLQLLSLSSNQFSGPIPDAIGNLSLLTALYLYSNELEGHIPSSLGNCKELNLLNLADNRLSGKLPWQLLKLPSLTISLNLSQNSLSDSIPSQIKDLKMLSELDLSYNNLTGTITSSLGECISLRVLYLNGNIFQGIIPSSLSSLRGLEVLDISQNNLSGKIPQFLDKWKLLDYLNLSFNDFEGEVLIEGVFANNKCNSQPSQSSGNERFFKVSYNELLKATDGFSAENLIGEGGFSSVYKGILDYDDGRFVAVKVLHLQNRGAHEGFLAECEAWWNIRHRNLLKIITSCSSVDFQRNNFKALVYEYMPNGSVHDWLHSNVNISKLNLRQRINILRDVATALDYLHNHCQTTIVHGDLKPSNILLDADMVAHVGDFGLARLLGTDLNQNNSSGVKGTIGYAPPEYGLGSEMSSIGDVYSFGILFLEVMTGKKPTDDMFNDGLSLHKFANMALPDHVIDVIDDDAIVLQRTEANAKKVEECMAATIKIGVSCSVDSPPQRMKIEIVVNELQRILEVFQNIQGTLFSPFAEYDFT
ncbi:kinase-like domain-containing protein, partial [Tanacetum coccineum]